jgi:hypothetical protein
VYRQRQLYKSEKLSYEKCCKLQEIGFELSKKIVPELIWDKYYEELKKYKLNFGDCNVPVHWKENKKLGIWVHGQRKNYHIGRFLSDERIKKLNDIGFEWDLRYKLKDRWEKFFNALLQFKAEHGHTDVPNTKGSKYKKLGVWVVLQRTNYRRKTFLSEERIQRLESIGFNWNLFEKGFTDKLILLEEFYRQNGHINIKSSTDPKFEMLKHWRGNLQNAFRNGRLSEEKIKKLEAAGIKLGKQNDKV